MREPKPKGKQRQWENRENGKVKNKREPNKIEEQRTIQKVKETG